VKSSPMVLAPEMGPDLCHIEQDRLEVIRVESDHQKSVACAMHLAKSTFNPERNLVKRRIFQGNDSPYHCKTWLLRQPPLWSSSETSSTASTTASSSAAASCSSVDEESTYLAAVTIRVNNYKNRCCRWAQVLNMSTRRERHGFGTLLMAGVEELLRQEGVDVVVLYPAYNGRAPIFWSSIGFCGYTVSHLPKEELIAHDRGGPLLPEFETSRHTPLPRWEKRIAPAVPAEEFSSRRAYHLHHSLPIAPSSISGAPLLAAAARLHAFRADLKAEYSAAPLKFPDGLPDVLAARVQGAVTGIAEDPSLGARMRRRASDAAAAAVASARVAKQRRKSSRKGLR